MSSSLLVLPVSDLLAGLCTACYPLVISLWLELRRQKYPCATIPLVPFVKESSDFLPGAFISFLTHPFCLVFKSSFTAVEKTCDIVMCQHKNLFALRHQIHPVVIDPWPPSLARFCQKLSKRSWHLHIVVYTILQLDSQWRAIFVTVLAYERKIIIHRIIWIVGNHSLSRGITLHHTFCLQGSVWALHGAAIDHPLDGLALTYLWVLPYSREELCLSSFLRATVLYQGLSLTFVMIGVGRLLNSLGCGGFHKDRFPLNPFKIKKDASKNTENKVFTVD